MTVGEAWAAERPLLRRAAGRRRSTRAETATPRVDAKSLVTVRQNRYSVPVAPGRAAGQRPDRRARDHGQPRRRARRPPRAAAGPLRHQRPARPLPRAARAQAGRARSTRWRCARNASAAAGRAASTSCGPRSTGRYGRSEAARQMVDVLLLCREHGPGRVELAVRGALAAGAHDGRAVAVLARRADATGRTPPPPLELPEPRLAAHARPAPTSPTTTQLLGGATMTRQREDRGVGGADRGARGRAQAPDRPPPLPRTRRRGHTRAADPGRLPRRAAGGRDRTNAPNGANAAASSTPASRRSNGSTTSASPTTRRCRRPRSPRSPKAPGSTTASR